MGGVETFPEFQHSSRRPVGTSSFESYGLPASCDMLQHKGKQHAVIV